jgi:hypothetical protein
MGRGLSELQQQLLVLAWQQRQQPPGSDYYRRARQADLYTHEALAAIWQWPHLPLRRWQNALGGVHFRQTEIGEGPYRAARVTLHRACQRLQRRGLVTMPRLPLGHSSGIVLTEAGAALAAQLSANKAHDEQN